MAEVNVNPVRKIFVFLVVFSMGHAVCGEVIRLKSGTDHTFKPRITGKAQTILWKYKGDKVVEFENNDLQWYRLKDRAELNRETGDFTLMKLSKDDSGQYDSEIQVAGVIRSSTHDIEVFDEGASENNTPVIVVSVLGVLAGLAALAGVVYYKFFPRNVHDRVSSN